MAAKLSSLPFFEAFWVIFCPDLVWRFFPLYVGRGVTRAFLMRTSGERANCEATQKFTALDEKLFVIVSLKTYFFCSSSTNSFESFDKQDSSSSTTGVFKGSACMCPEMLYNSSKAHHSAVMLSTSCQV